MNGKHYQFRANPALEAEIQSAWMKGMSTSDNLFRIIKAGVKSLKKGNNDVKKQTEG